MNKNFEDLNSSGKGPANRLDPLDNIMEAVSQSVNEFIPDSNSSGKGPANVPDSNKIIEDPFFRSDMRIYSAAVGEFYAKLKLLEGRTAAKLRKPTESKSNEIRIALLSFLKSTSKLISESGKLIAVESEQKIMSDSGLGLANGTKDLTSPTPFSKERLLRLKSYIVNLLMETMPERQLNKHFPEVAFKKIILEIGNVLGWTHTTNLEGTSGLMFDLEKIHGEYLDHRILTWDITELEKAKNIATKFSTHDEEEKKIIGRILNAIQSREDKIHDTIRTNRGFPDYVAWEARKRWRKASFSRNGATRTPKLENVMRSLGIFDGDVSTKSVEMLSLCMGEAGLPKVYKEAKKILERKDILPAEAEQLHKIMSAIRISMLASIEKKKTSRLKRMSDELQLSLVGGHIPLCENICSAVNEHKPEMWAPLLVEIDTALEELKKAKKGIKSTEKGYPSIFYILSQAKTLLNGLIRLDNVSVDEKDHQELE